MTEKELLSKLNNLKDIKPDKKWKEKSRGILMSQIYSGDYNTELNKLPGESSFVYYLRSFIHQPVLVVTMILIIVLGGGIFSISASKDTKPGDSFYIAKIISERAQLAITFNEESKARLGIEFAGNRAKEITQVLAEDDNSSKEEKVKKLTKNFQKEINSAKNRLRNISLDKNSENNDEESMEIFSANLGKEDRGMQVYSQPEKNNEQADADENTEAQNKDIIITTPENITEASSTASVPSDVEIAIEEAEKLFAEEDYSGTLDKLEEVINQIDEDNNKEGEVKGESESLATTTDKASGAGE